MRPLEGLLVLEFCQFLAGPSAGLRLADLGARVIKIERPGKGEAGRKISIKDLFIEDDSLVFHTINRNKESYAANLKDAADLERVKRLIERADIITHNFRPGVMEKIGLDYDSVKRLNPKIIYAIVTGYGGRGPWANKPGQDLLVQSMSGLTWLSGSSNDGPVPFGLAAADIFCGAHLTQGILAALLKRSKTGKSVLVEVSLLESALDIQFEFLTTHLNDGGKLPQRTALKGGAHAYLSAPYGVYQTKDGYLALAMGNLLQLGEALRLDLASGYPDPFMWFDKRDEIISLIQSVIKTETTRKWLSVLEPLNIWCAEVLNYQEITQNEGYKVMGIAQQVELPDGSLLTTTRCPIQINQKKLYSKRPAPKPGVHTALINEEFEL